MSEKLHDLKLSPNFVPTKVTGEVAKFLVDDLQKPATEEAEVMRSVLLNRAFKKVDIHKEYELEVACAMETPDVGTKRKGNS